MSKYEADQALDNAMVNANNVISYAKRLESQNLDHAKAIESIGYSLHALARALKEISK